MEIKTFYEDAQWSMGLAEYEIGSCQLLMKDQKNGGSA
jgi:hypothetical protein